MLALAVALLAVFTAGMWRNRSLGPVPRGGWVGVMFVILLALVWIAPEFLWVAFPLWMVAAAVLPLLPAFLLAASTVAMSITVLAMAGGHSVGTVLGPVTGALIAIGLARGVLLLEAETEQNRRLMRELVGAQHRTAQLQREAGMLAERTRLAHDIHDTLAQARRVVYALAPSNAGAGGLAEPLRRLAEETAGAIGATATVRVDPDLPRLSTTSEVALLHGAQGALANVRQHSRATRLVLDLARAGNEVRLDVVDDGVGFDTTDRRDRTPVGGYGLTALRERLSQLGGNLETESEVGIGTAVSLSPPLRIPESDT